MPTRRIFEVIVVVSFLMHPAFGLIKMWARKTLGTDDSDNATYKAAEIGSVLS